MPRNAWIPRIIVLMLLLAAVAVAAVFIDPTRVVLGWLAGEAFYGGRPASYWAGRLHATEPSARTNAIKALTDGKADAVPVLIELVRWQAPERGAAGQVRWSAAQVLFQIGADARAAVPALAEALSDPEPLVRTLAVKALSKQAEGAASAMPALARLLGGGERLDVLQALHDLGPAAHAAVPDLTRLLDDKEVKVRWHAALALGRIGAAAKTALPALQALLRDPDRQVRDEARKAIIRVDPQALPNAPQQALPMDAPDAPKDQSWRRLLHHPLAWIAAAVALAGPLAFFLFVQGCGSRPRAPALVDEPVYQNQQEGFRFFTPAGWRIQGRGEFHSGTKLEKERMLVEYRRIKKGPFASLMVSMVDLPEAQPLAEYLHKRLEKKQTWRSKGVDKITLANQLAERFTFLTKGEGGEMTREIVALRRGERVYFFTAIYTSSDASARDEMRKAVGSLTF